MKLPAKVRYAIKAVTELAIRQQEGGVVRLSDLAQAQRIPKNYLLQLLIRLKNAGIVVSTRGVSGGYALAVHPAQVSLAVIVRAIDGGILESPKAPGQVKATEPDRIVARLWKDINESVSDRLEGVTLERLVAQVSADPISYTI